MLLNLYCAVLLYMGELVNSVCGFGFVLFFWLTKSVLYQFWSTFKPPAASLLPCRFARDAKGTTV